MTEIEAGASFEIAYPYTREGYTGWDEDGPYETKTWRPGVRFELVGPEGGDADAVADGVGSAVFNIVSVHKPGKYPARVFFTRTWIDPAGRAFGKAGLRICTMQKFRRLTRGYAYPYAVEAATKEGA